MDTPPPSMRDLAQRLLAMEAARHGAAGSPMQEAARACEALRIALTRVAGAEGFATLMRRALALARAEFPSLQNVQVNPDGSLAGLEELDGGSGAPQSEHTRAHNRAHPSASGHASSNPSAGAAGAGPAVALIACLLGLLVTFIGESLTLRLVRGAWPEASLEMRQS